MAHVRVETRTMTQKKREQSRARAYSRMVNRRVDSGEGCPCRGCTADREQGNYRTERERIYYTTAQAVAA